MEVVTLDFTSPQSTDASLAKAQAAGLDGAVRQGATGFVVLADKDKKTIVGEINASDDPAKISSAFAKAAGS